MSDISLGQAIGIIGGVPILKNVLGHTVDHLKIPRHLDIGTTPSILSAVLSGGAGALLQSPLGSALGSLTSTVTSAISSLGTGSYAPLVQALNNISGSATNLSALADNLVGVATNAGLPTQLDAVAHMSAVQPLGASVPEALSLATVLAPVSSAPALAAAQAAIQSSVAATLSGETDVISAAQAVANAQATLDLVSSASTSAIATVQAAQPALCAAQSAIALLVGGTPEMQAAMNIAIRPDMLSTVQAIVDAHLATLAVAAAQAPA